MKKLSRTRKKKTLQVQKVFCSTLQEKFRGHHHRLMSESSLTSKDFFDAKELVLEPTAEVEVVSAVVANRMEAIEEAVPHHNDHDDKLLAVPDPQQQQA